MPITKKEKVEILQKLGYYNKKFGREATRLGFTRDEYYEIWRENFRLMEEEDRAFTLEEIGDQIQTIREGKERQPFELVLRSYINPNMRRTLRFKNLYHFNNWERQILREVVTGDLDSAGNPTIDYVTDDAFRWALYEINDIVGGNSTKKDKNALKPIREFKGKFQKFKVRQVDVQCNNCGLECVKYLLKLYDSYHSMRKFLGKKGEEKLTPEEVIKVYNHACPTGSLTIHNIDSTHIINTTYSHHILYHKNHYYVILEAEQIPYETEDKVKRGVIYWDIETRKTEDYCMIGDTKSYYLKDVILHAHVKKYKSTDYEHLNFTTNSNQSACRQFLEWLQQQGREQKYYYLYAHNGGNFDTYFLLMNFNKEEEGKYIPTLRGTTIIKLDYGNNIFLDSYCFLTNSLKKLSENFKVEQEKLRSFIVNGEELTNEQLCFYKPELTFNQFLELEHNEPEFWELYNKYCYVDCIALQQVWDKFTININKLIDVFVEKAPYRKADLLTKCGLRQSCTIGGHAQKILNALNGVNDKLKNARASNYFKNFAKFIDSKEKHDFIMNNFKRGGISHCNKKGKHTEGVMSVDICSQYPASMVHMKIPSGYSRWVTEYDENAYGFYILRNLVFDTKYTFKPVCEVLDTGVLNWRTYNCIERLPLDSYMIKYLKEHYGLLSFEVENGLVSNYELDGSKLFGAYVNTLFSEKALQDKYKDDKDYQYNPAYRETIKLYLNSITGKLVMNREKYSSLTFCSEELEGVTKNINGVSYLIEKKENMNEWIHAGVMVYSYSKRLLFEYIRNMPNNSDDIIHVETDSMYFPISCENEFNANIEKYDGQYPVKYGVELGNIKVEQKTNMPAFYLNKKAYCMYDEHENKYKFVYKGIPKATIDADGTKKQILTYELYEKVYNHKQGDKPITIEFMTMSRQLFGQTKISGHRQIRTLNSTYDYQEY